VQVIGVLKNRLSISIVKILAVSFPSAQSTVTTGARQERTNCAKIKISRKKIKIEEITTFKPRLTNFFELKKIQRK
jgi:hypothetical protein